MKPIELVVPLIRIFHIRVVMLFPVILYVSAVDRSDPCLRVHEHYHWRQQMRWLVLPWFTIYGLLWLANWGKPAESHPMEREAYRLERECERGIP